MAEKYEDEFSYVQVCSRKNPCCNHSFKISMTSRATESKKSTNNTCTPTKRKSSISKKKLFILELVTVLFLLASCEWVVYLVQTTTTCISQVRYSSEAVSIMTMTNSDNFEWALRESNGFFDNIPAEEWKRLREIAHNQALAEQKAPPLQGNTRSSMLLRQASHVYQEHWDPDFSCRHDTKVGMGDGGKWICDPHRLEAQSQVRLRAYNHSAATAATAATNTTTPKPGCIIYSVGSQGKFEFEEALLNQLPFCEIHTFDFNPQYATRAPPGVFYHAWGLKASYNETKPFRWGGYQSPETMKRLGEFKTFEETKKELGHEGLPIDIFKIDCEGCEWATYKDWINADIRQLLVEVHDVPAISIDFFRDFHDAGYVIFHKEPNIQWGGGQCIEYAMLKLSKEFFQTEELVAEAQNQMTHKL